MYATFIYQLCSVVTEFMIIFYLIFWGIPTWNCFCLILNIKIFSNFAMYILVLKKVLGIHFLTFLYVRKKNFALIYPKFYKFGKFIDKIKFG